MLFLSLPPCSLSRMLPSFLFYASIIKVVICLALSLLLCEGCTYYCSVNLVTVIGDSGLCLFYQWVWSEGDLMFYSNGRCRKGSFCHRSTLVWCDVKAMVCYSCPCHCYLCPPCSPTPTSFSLIPLSLSTLLCFSLASVSSLSLSLPLSLPLSFSSSLYIIISYLLSYV